MSARSDAEKLIADVDYILDDHRVTHSDEHAWQYAQAIAMQAVASAVLALADEHRTANLIALWTVEEGEAAGLARAGLNFGGILTQIVKAVS